MLSRDKSLSNFSTKIWNPPLKKKHFFLSNETTLEEKLDF